MMKYEYNDEIIMRNNTSNEFPSFFSFSNYLRPKKRRYNEMLSQSNQTLINNRIDNYKLSEQAANSNSLLNNVINNNEKEKLTVINYNDFNDINKAKKNLAKKKYIEYDEEKERQWVENYYKIINSQLNKLRFGNE